MVCATPVPLNFYTKWLHCFFTTRLLLATGLSGDFLNYPTATVALDVTGSLDPCPSIYSSFISKLYNLRFCFLWNTWTTNVHANAWRWHERINIFGATRIVLKALNLYTWAINVSFLIKARVLYWTYLAAGNGLLPRYCSFLQSLLLFLYQSVFSFWGSAHL